jgi:hypothetical protein
MSLLPLHPHGFVMSLSDVFFVLSPMPDFSIQFISFALRPAPPLFNICRDIIRSFVTPYNAAHLRIEDDWLARYSLLPKLDLRRKAVRALAAIPHSIRQWNSSLPLYIASGISCHDTHITSSSSSSPSLLSPLRAISSRVACAPSGLHFPHPSHKAVVDACVLRSAQSLAAARLSSLSHFVLASRCMDRKCLNPGMRVTTEGVSSALYAAEWEKGKGEPCWGMSCGCDDLVWHHETAAMDY